MCSHIENAAQTATKWTCTVSTDGHLFECVQFVVCRFLFGSSVFSSFFAVCVFLCQLIWPQVHWIQSHKMSKKAVCAWAEREVKTRAVFCVCAKYEMKLANRAYTTNYTHKCQSAFSTIHIKTFVMSNIHCYALFSMTAVRKLMSLFWFNWPWGNAAVFFANENSLGFPGGHIVLSNI